VRSTHLDEVVLFHVDSFEAQCRLPSDSTRIQFIFTEKLIGKSYVLHHNDVRKGQGGYSPSVRRNLLSQCEL
jgi:hypothetical protein